MYPNVETGTTGVPSTQLRGLQNRVVDLRDALDQYGIGVVALIALAGVAGSAAGMTLATTVALPAVRHPVVLAKAITSLAVLSEGPVVAASLLRLADRRPACYCAHNLESSFRHRLDESGMSLAALQRFERPKIIPANGRPWRCQSCART